jgi:hypothetical protein
MIKRRINVTMGILLALAAWSCKKETRDPCEQPRTTVVRVHTYRHADTGTAVIDTLLPNPILVPLTGGTTLYYYGGVKRISTFALTLSNVADSSRWMIWPDSANSTRDTVTIYYSRQPRFLSNACGYTNFYNLQRVVTTQHALDSIIIARGDVTTDANVEHLKFYY